MCVCVCRKRAYSARSTVIIILLGVQKEKEKSLSPWSTGSVKKSIRRGQKVIPWARHCLPFDQISLNQQRSTWRIISTSPFGSASWACPSCPSLDTCTQNRRKTSLGSPKSPKSEMYSAAKSSVRVVMGYAMPQPAQEWLALSPPSLPPNSTVLEGEPSTKRFHFPS